MKKHTKYTKQYTGFSLLELMLVLVFIVGASAVAYKWFATSSVQAAVKEEQESSGRIVDKIMGAFTTFGNYSEVGTDTVAGILNVPYNSSSESIDSSLKKDLQITPDRFRTENDSFRLTYKGLDRKTCIALIPAMSSRSNGVFVGSNSNIQTKPGQEPDGGVISTQCASANVTDVGFRFSSDKAEFDPVTEMTSGLCAPETETQVLPCPANSAGSITQRRTSTCDTTDPQNPQAVWSSWVTANNTCAANSTPVPPRVPVAPNNTCGALTEYQSVTCPSGQTGSIIQYRTQSCPTNTWGAWTDLQNSCRPIATMGTCRPETKRKTFECPTGQWGQIYAEFATQCDLNGNTISADESVLSNWKIINTNCTASCVATGNCCTVTRRPVETSTTPCQAGWYGPGVTTRRQQSSQCPTHDGAPVWNDSGWSKVGDDTGQCNRCTPNQTTQAVQWVPRAGSCPAGQTGTLMYNDEQVQDIVTTRLCNSQAGVLNDNATTTVSAWRNTGNTVVASNTCVNVPTKSCAVAIGEYSYGTSDTRDAYYTVSYTIQGVTDSCTATYRDNRDPSICLERMLSREAWANAARDGETYYVSGSESGWGGGGGEFWGWEAQTFERRSGAACP